MTPAIVAALDAGRLHSYVCDFPNNALKDHAKVVDPAASGCLHGRG